jgi:hypothetical protein
MDGQINTPNAQPRESTVRPSPSLPGDKATPATPAGGLDQGTPLTSYLCQCASTVRFSDDNVHNPIGIPGLIYCDPARAMCLLNRSMGGRIPLDRFGPGSEVWLHLPMGTTLSRMAIDAARNLTDEWKQSMLNLIGTLRLRGVRVVVYVGAMHHHVDEESARYALNEYVRAARSVGFDLAIDSAATAHAEPYADDLLVAAHYLISAGRRLYVEGMWSRAMHERLTPGVWQFLERQTVERSFTDGWDPASVIAPDPQRLVIWDQSPRGEWSTRQEATQMMAEGVPQARAGLTSAIGAQRWRPGLPGQPRLLVSRTDLEGRRLLGVAQEETPT